MLTIYRSTIGADHRSRLKASPVGDKTAASATMPTIAYLNFLHRKSALTRPKIDKEGHHDRHFKNQPEAQEHHVRLIKVFVDLDHRSEGRSKIYQKLIGCRKNYVVAESRPADEKDYRKCKKGHHIFLFFSIETGRNKFPHFIEGQRKRQKDAPQHGHLHI